MANTPNYTPSLQDLAKLAEARTENAPDNPLLIESVSLNGAEVEPGGLFAALPGTRVHGASYAATSAAGAILTDDAGLTILQEAGEERPVLVVDNVREILGAVSAEIYGHPSQDLTILGVTGTSGKTTTTYLLEAGLLAAGYKVGIIGTTGTRIDGRLVPTKLTTPEAPMLQTLFRMMVDEGVTHVVMEVSSHAISLGRVDGTRFAVAGFTNLSQDHLDFHPTMEEYFETKAKLFDPAAPWSAERSVICIDDDWGETLAKRIDQPATVGTKGQRAVTCSARRIKLDPTGAQDIEFTIGNWAHKAHLSLPGDFNIANAALATTMAYVADIDVDSFLRGVEKAGVPGRMERIDEGQDFVAVVDYAHKPAAVAAVLDTLRFQVDGRVGVVVGAGGDRDATKRPIMGAEAARRADLVIITDDNPRSENPALIREAVVAGARQAKAEENLDVVIREIPSRASAIDHLIQWAQAGDAVIVTGKGHEVGQIVGDTTHHFDDREEVRRALGHYGRGKN
ncbi:UDP-N-acetylmuramoyl-L-alanyl-D-glutamate--2,6-diaminopimelate ligase [Corynebacterium breve]|uniref:UDP-N-acetylmuramoyl-L-alanyl-D-glutamate--2,6-diaminopimelate ligase n=1 Tax=Corynebacterium breve TaxID=3049799 RepID=A0ABY8VFD7_9CORY|nr:UDP-N-acetylmuramoyl-L-alanyl-D-glutamate--2,6-diaminopimelate ligase [Corynebacterium breve]WIM66978.1 UDP-N-acetylmuramoyl-L-alanyl-D-glutamate--2,6-diaminopimelate ligase [Corynebacterium breve]